MSRWTVPDDDWHEPARLNRLSAGLAKRLFILPWLPVPPIGFVELSKLASARERIAAVLS